MKCPVCGQQLRPGKKDPNYLLCYNCKKKYKAPQSETGKQETRGSKKSTLKQEAKPSGSSASSHRAKKSRVRDDEDEQRYSNLPPKKVRDKREEEMRRAYDEMLAVGDGKGKKKRANTKKRQRDYEDDYYDDEYDDYDDEKVSKAPIIILGVAIVVVAAAIAYLLFFK